MILYRITLAYGYERCYFERDPRPTRWQRWRTLVEAHVFAVASEQVRAMMRYDAVLSVALRGAAQVEGK